MSKRPNLENLESLADILYPALTKHGMLWELKELQAILLWGKVVGTKIAKKTKPQRIENGVLFVKVKGAAWRQELVFHKQELIKKLNKELGEQVVKDLTLV